MPLNRLIREGDNPDITDERLKATFDTDQLAAELKGGFEKLERKRKIEREVDARPEFHDTISPGHMSRVEKVDNASRKVREVLQKMGDFANPQDYFDNMCILLDVYGAEGQPLSIHWLMFLPTLMNQLDEEQEEWWLWKAINGEILGTYAQTEMGHGTNLSKIETEAIYDPSTEEFVLNSPTTTSLKWWPGGLGNTANHVVLVANLIIKGKNYGPHIFMVQIRDMETHKPLKGIRVGDIGAKMGVLAVDNGFLGFDHHRIPRRHMLMRYSKVEKDGTYVAPAHAKMSYSTMLWVRAEIVLHVAQYLRYGCTIATRYSAVRRQGEITPGAGEVKILDYQTQQNRIFPNIARALAYQFAGEDIQTQTNVLLEKMKKANVTDSIADLHAISCGLKAFVAYEGCLGIDQCRMSCGGHGYSEASYFPTLYGCSVASCTYEGENIVMLLQTAKYLLKAAAAARAGSSLSSNVEYLGRKSSLHSLIDRTSSADFSHYLSDYEHVARKRVFEAFDRIVALKKTGMKNDEALNANGILMTKAANSHARLYIARAFYQRVQRVVDQNSKAVLSDVLQLYLNNELLQQAAELMEDNYMSGDQLKYLKEDLYRAFAKVRPNAVSIVDAFDFGDRELRSVLGRRDGHVYDNLYKWAQQSPLNQHPDGVNPTFHKYLKPLMKGERSKL